MTSKWYFNIGVVDRFQSKSNKLSAMKAYNAYPYYCKGNPPMKQ